MPRKKKKEEKQGPVMPRWSQRNSFFPKFGQKKLSTHEKIFEYYLKPFVKFCIEARLANTVEQSLDIFFRFNEREIKAYKCIRPFVLRGNKNEGGLNFVPNMKISIAYGDKLVVRHDKTMPDRIDVEPLRLNVYEEKTSRAVFSLTREQFRDILKYLKLKR